MLVDKAGNQIPIEAADLKIELQRGNIKVVNLKLTSDNRLIEVENKLSKRKHIVKR